MSSITSAASHVEDAVVNHPLDTFNSVAFAPIAAMDALTGTHAIKAIGEIEKGAVDEVIHHPGEILKDVAIGAAVGALTVATGGGALVALGLGAAALATTELVKNDGSIDGVVNDAKALGNSVVDWGNDLAVVAGSGPHTKEEELSAEAGLRQLGAFGAQTAAGIAGGVAGGAGVAAAGLDGVVPRTAVTVASKFKLPLRATEEPGGAAEVPVSGESPSVPGNLVHRVVKDGRLEIAQPTETLNPGDTFLPAQNFGLSYREVGDAIEIASPVSTSMPEQACRGLSEIPEGVRDVVFLEGNTKIRLCEKVTDPYPHLAGTKPSGYDSNLTFENNPAFYDTGNNEIVLAQTYKYGPDGPQVSAMDVANVVRHEFGHAFDRAENYISQRTSFDWAWRKDVENIKAFAQKKDIDQLAYFIKNDSEWSARSESFAEGFAVLTGQSQFSSLFRTWLPQTLSQIQSHIDIVS